MRDPRYETVDGHIHGWDPIPLRVARYRCACGVHAWKDPRGVMRIAKKRYYDETVLVTRVGQSGRKPTMGQQEERMGRTPWDVSGYVW